MPSARLPFVAAIATVLTGCATNETTLSPEAPLPPAAVVIERTPDLFAMPPSRNYPRSLFAFFLKPQFQSTRLGRVAVGSGLSSTPITSPASLILTNVANGLLVQIETEALRDELGKYDVALSDPRYGTHLDDTFGEALRATLWDNVTQVVPIPLADELPPGRPDYKEVTSQKREQERSIEEAFQIELKIRPALVPTSGQVSVMTTLKYHDNEHPAFPRNFRAQASVFSQSVGQENLGFWLDNDRANLKRFYECAAAESMHIFKQAMAGEYRRDKATEKIEDEDLFKPDGRMAVFFASRGDVLDRSGNRLRLAFVDGFYGSVIFDSADLSGGLTEVAEREVMAGCRAEPMFEG